jgi:CheY-like chemotaxis protein
MSAPPDLKHVKVLLADDDSTTRSLLRRTLGAWGATVKETTDGAETLVELKRAREAGQPYGLILLDARMPAMDGFEVARELRTHPAELQHTILMLPPDKASELVRAREAAVGAHVVKPISRIDLTSAITKVIGEAPAAPAQPATAGGEDRTPLRVLVVEDNKDTCQLIEYYLDSPEFKVDVAENGGIGVDLYRMMEYDVVLMDVMMPIMDGYMATDAIRRWEKKNAMRPAPIIAMTAYARTEDARKSLRAGCDAYLVKPFTREVLRSTILKQLGRRATAKV